MTHGTMPSDVGWPCTYLEHGHNPPGHSSPHPLDLNLPQAARPDAKARSSVAGGDWWKEQESGD